MSIESAIVKKLSDRVNVSAGLTHPLDESAAKELLKEIVSRGYTLNPSDIYAEAQSCGWSPKHAKSLSDLAKKISSGRRVVIKHSYRWNPEVFDEIENQA